MFGKIKDKKSFNYDIVYEKRGNTISYYSYDSHPLRKLNISPISLFI